MQSFEQFFSLVNTAIHNVKLPNVPANLYEPIAYTMALGGKRLRPILTLMTCQAFRGNIHEAMNAALALEFFHNSTLVHDDVIDHADLRRGKPTVHRKWGEETAVLCGDTMFAIAARLMAKVGPEHLPATMNVFIDTATRVFEGQQMDLDFKFLTDVETDEYMAMARLKTADLLGAACRLGAIIAGASPANEQAIYNAGVNMGLAFQLQDDLLDVWGDPAVFGKDTGGDIMNNNKTFLLISAISLADDITKTELRRWLNDPYALREQKVPAVTAIYERLGLKQLTVNKIEQYNAEAVKLVKSTGMSPDDADRFISLIHSLTSRNA